MNVFVVISLYPQPALQARVFATFPNDVLSISDTAWLVAASGTAQDISGRIGLVSGEFNSAVVVGLANYHGRAPVNIWDWIKAKLEAPANG